MNNEVSMAEVKPEVAFLYELIREVLAGKVRIPKFQRPFVWRRDQMLELLGSLHLQYPIGSLLVWETDEPLASSDWVGPVHISKSKQGFASYVLDGQQRLSTLVGALQKPRESEDANAESDDPGRWSIWFNAKTKGFEHHRHEEKCEAWHFPLWSLMDTVEFLKECQRILESSDSEAVTYVNAIQDLTRTFSSYKMPVIRLRNTKLSQAVDIFARLNSKGQTMSPDQMVSALSYSEVEGRSTFNLAEEIDELINRLDDLGFGEINRTVVLRSFLAAMEVNIYRADWTRLTDISRGELSKSLPTVIEKTGEALVSAVKFLHSLGVYTTRLLPYAMQLVVLAAFFLKCEKPTLEQISFLRRWFWVSSFTSRFASGNPSRDGELVAEFRDEISQISSPTGLKNMRMDTAADSFPANFDMRSARARTWLIVLLSLKPKDQNGKEISSPWSAIAQHGPNAIGRVLATVLDKELAASPANRIFRIDMENRAQARSWLLVLSNLQLEVRNVILESHGISSTAFDFLMKNDTDNFLRTRRDHLIAIERDFMKKERVTLPLDLEPRQSAIDSE
jgi:hypothetical protein